MQRLLNRHHNVRVVVRSPDTLPVEIRESPNISVVIANILELSDDELSRHAMDCDAVVSCLGHVVSFKGMFGEPRRLCTDAARRLCRAIEKNNAAKPVKFILMSTVAVANPALHETRTAFDRWFLAVLRHVLPPHRDNETAAEYLHRMGRRHEKLVEWCAVRPDSLIDAAEAPYVVEESPSTGIFAGRPTARSNVAHFMAELIEDAELWTEWKFRMPVIMNAAGRV